MYQQGVNGSIHDVATPSCINFLELSEKDRILLQGLKYPNWYNFIESNVIDHKRYTSTLWKDSQWVWSNNLYFGRFFIFMPIYGSVNVTYFDYEAISYLTNEIS